MVRIDQEKAAAWREIVAERVASGMTTAAFCRDRGIAVHQYGYWARRLAATTLKPGAAPVPASGLFVCVDDGGADGGSGVRVTCGPFGIELAPGFCETTLSRALAALSAAHFR